MNLTCNSLIKQIYYSSKVEHSQICYFYGKEENLVQYFHNKERVIPASIKNNVIYQGGVENSFQEIIRLYNVKGKNI